MSLSQCVTTTTKTFQWFPAPSQKSGGIRKGKIRSIGLSAATEKALLWGRTRIPSDSSREHDVAARAHEGRKTVLEVQDPSSTRDSHSRPTSPILVEELMCSHVAFYLRVAGEVDVLLFGRSEGAGLVAQCFSFLGLHCEKKKNLAHNYASFQSSLAAAEILQQRWDFSGVSIAQLPTAWHCPPSPIANGLLIAASRANGAPAPKSL